MATKLQQREKTRAALIASARRLFAAEGFAGASTEAILAETEVTRGALYHHFATKQDLFAAVCEALHAEAAERVDRTASATDDIFEGLVVGCLAFIDFVVRPDVRRILILDAPGVLGWERWNDMDRRHSFGLLTAGIEQAVREGVFAGDPEVLAVLINGALNHAVLWAGQAGDPAAVARLKAGFIKQFSRLRVDRR